MKLFTISGSGIVNVEGFDSNGNPIGSWDAANSQYQIPFLPGDYVLEIDKGSCKKKKSIKIDAEEGCFLWCYDKDGNPFLSPYEPQMDIYVDGFSYDAENMNLILTDNSSDTPDITIPLAMFIQYLAQGNNTTLGGDGTQASPWQVNGYGIVVNNDGTLTIIDPTGNQSIYTPPKGCCTYNHNEEGANAPIGATVPSMIPVTLNQGDTVIEKFDDKLIFWTYNGTSWNKDFEWKCCPVEPVGEDDLVNTPFNIAVSGSVATNDTDPNGPDADLTYSTSYVMPISQGTLVFNADGSYTFVPNINFTGKVEIPYELTDGETLSDAAILCINVSPPKPVVKITSEPNPNEFDVDANEYNEYQVTVIDLDGTATIKTAWTAGPIPSPLSCPILDGQTIKTEVRHTASPTIVATDEWVRPDTLIEILDKDSLEYSAVKICVETTAFDTLQNSPSQQKSIDLVFKNLDGTVVGTKTFNGLNPAKFKDTFVVDLTTEFGGVLDAKAFKVCSITKDEIGTELVPPEDQIFAMARVSTLNQSDPRNVEITPSGSLDCEGNPILDYSTYCVTYPLFLAHATERQAANTSNNAVGAAIVSRQEHFRVPFVTVEVCNGIATYDWTGSIVTDPVDRTSLEGLIVTTGTPASEIVFDKLLVDRLLKGYDFVKNGDYSFIENNIGLSYLATAGFPVTIAQDGSRHDEGAEIILASAKISDANCNSPENPQELIVQKFIKRIKHTGLQIDQNINLGGAIPLRIREDDWNGTRHSLAGGDSPAQTFASLLAIGWVQPINSDFLVDGVLNAGASPVQNISNYNQFNSSQGNENNGFHLLEINIGSTEGMQRKIAVLFHTTFATGNRVGSYRLANTNVIWKNDGGNFVQGRYLKNSPSAFSYGVSASGLEHKAVDSVTGSTRLSRTNLGPANYTPDRIAIDCSTIHTVTMKAPFTFDGDTYANDFDSQVWEEKIVETY